MKKIILPLVIACFVTSLLAQKNNYRVQVGAFAEKVDLSYFDGLEGVWGAQDHNDIYRYNLGDYATPAEAEEVAAMAKQKGFVHSQVIDLESIYSNCNSCSPNLYVRSIFFDFDQSYLRTQSKSDLNALVDILEANPTYQVELQAHTDSRGSNEYNVALSKRRAKSARTYLVNQGISDGRIVTRHFGEGQPIAKNEVSGGDSPKGRQYNRRVVVSVLDANGDLVPNVVEDIDVPSGLRAN